MNAVMLNHFPIRSDLMLYRSIFHHPNPTSYLGYLRAQGFHARVQGGEVWVEMGTEPTRLIDPKRRAVRTEQVCLDDDWTEYKSALNAHLGDLLVQGGHVALRGAGKLSYVQQVGQRLAPPPRCQPAFEVNGHVTWQWDWEVHQGRLWLVPLAQTRWLSQRPLVDPAVSGWARQQLEQGVKLHTLELRTGAKREVYWQQGLGWLERSAKPSDFSPTAQLTLSLPLLADLEMSSAAHAESQRRVHRQPEHQLQALFSTVLESFHKFSIASSAVHKVSGDCLQFARSRSAKSKDVFQRGMYSPPPQSVHLLLCLPQDAPQRLKDCIAVQLYDEQVIERRKLQRPSSDTFRQIWAGKSPQQLKLGLDLYAVHKEAAYFDVQTGTLTAPEVIAQAREKACQEGRVPLALMVLPDAKLEQAPHDALHRHFKGQMAVHQVRESIFTVQGATELFTRQAEVALSLAKRAGGVPWRLVNVPGTCSETFFLGLDLGHHHQDDHSHLALTLYSASGEELDRDVWKLKRNNERIPDKMLHENIPRWLQRALGKRSVKHLVVHRDGRYHTGELLDLQVGFCHVPQLTCLGIKKDTLSRFSGSGLDGLYHCLDDRRALLVTNTHSGDQPVPLEVELALGTDLVAAVEQVCWLSRLHQSGAFHLSRLPATTERANNIAGTGKRVHLSSFRGTP